MSLMINMSLSETAEVASRGSSDTNFIIEYRAPTATIKIIFMSSVRFRYCKPKIFAVSSTGRAKEYLVPWYIYQSKLKGHSAVIAHPVRVRLGSWERVGSSPTFGTK